MASATSSYIAPNDPQFSIPELNYAAVETAPDGSLRISETYRYLDLHRREAILNAWADGHTTAASALANCGRYGSVSRRCKKRNAAKAQRHTCHLWICTYCGSGRNLLRTWLRWRDPEVQTARQYGMELRGPLDGAGLSEATTKLTRWLKDNGHDSVFRVVITAKPKFAAVRLVVRADQSPFRDISTHFHKLTDHAPGYCVQPYYDSTAMRTLQWMFESTTGILESCGHVRAAAYHMYYRKQLTRTTGEFYKELDEETQVQLREDEHQEEAATTCNCGECDGHMEVIPHEERHTQTVEDIEREYKHVDWSSTYDPFHVRRISHNKPLMTDSTEGTASCESVSHAPPS